MAELSKIAPIGRVAVTIDVLPHWADHHFQGRVVLPAVEAMQLLAHWVHRFRTGLDVRCINEAAFDRFLELPPTGGRIEAWCEMEDLADGGLRTALLTKIPSKSARMTRAKVHAKLDFYPPVELPPPADLDLASALDGVCFSVDPGLIYKELVPFGPGFQTICQPLRLTAEGALAVIRAPEGTDGQTELHLGSPFVLDGAFHAACVWSQRFAGVVAFPVGIGQRLIATPTRPGDIYVSRIFPVQTESGLLIFDIWIVDTQGRLFEKLEGVRMRDVSGGKVRPPEWIRSCEGTGSLKRIACHSAAVAMIDRSTLMPFSDRCLAEYERRRTIKMGTKRLTDYLSARLACKRLSRQLSGNDRCTPAQEIVTIATDGVRPCCPVTNGRTYYCSVSHDRRFAVAVASEKPIGMDVETLDGRVLKSLHLFMDADEQETVRASALGPVGAAVRVWTTKEAVAKMLNINLADAWARTHLLTIEAEQSSVRINDGPAATVVHQTVEDHLVTLVCGVG
ncbi:MAG: polyketide synthase dehydratase domain-containing protein [Syntrophobacteraceae bacterium]|jgi:phosphopantetheinyl transferase